MGEWPLRRLVPALAAVLVGGLLAGCSGDSTASRMHVLRIGVPVHELVWDDQAGVFVGLTQDDRHLVRLDPSGHMKLSAALSDVGENVAVSPDGSKAYLPQPALNRVATFAVSDLRQTGTLRVGTQPSLVDVADHADALLALSANGTTVSGVDLSDHTGIPSTTVDAGPHAELDAGVRDRRVGFHVIGSHDVALYQSGTFSAQRPERKGTVPVVGGPSAGDFVKDTQAYIAVRGTGRIVVVDETRTLDGLHIVARADVGEPVREIGVDDNRVYAATDNKLVIFETNNFVGFANGKLPVLRTIHYRHALPAKVRSAPLAGLVVGDTGAYLEFEHQPYLLRVEAPSV